MEITQLYDLYLQHPAVQTDTRKLRPGEIFFALSGPNFNGNTFAQKALDEGAALVVIDDANYNISSKCILVDDVLATLQQLALHHRKQLSIPFLAITGSNGKTTTKELIAAVLQKKYVICATQGNLNNHIGVPLTLLGIKPGTEIAIIEMGANHMHEIAAYCSIALPTHGLITNCGKAHIEGFGGIEGVRKGKGELYDFLRGTDGIIFRNTDLDYLEQMALGIARQVTYGEHDADYCGKPLMQDVFLNVALMTPHTGSTIPTRLVGVYNFPNVMASVAVGLHFGVSPDEIRDAIAGYNPDNSRSQWLQQGSNRIIMDAYNANPSSMQAAIINFAAADLQNKMLWLGGMKEMGPEELNEHKALVSLISDSDWNEVILVGKEFKDVNTNYRWFENSAEAAAYIRAHLPVNASILIKGSRGSKMEVMKDALI